MAYSIFQQGSGLVDAAAVQDETMGCANQGMDVSADLANEHHYQGNVSQDANGDFYLLDGDGNPQSDTYYWAGTYYWRGTYYWSGNFDWESTFRTSGNTDWSTTSIATNLWVPQE